MSSVNRLFVCSLRCTASRLNVPAVVLKRTKFSLCGSLLVDRIAKSANCCGPRVARVLSGQCWSWHPVVRAYRTAPTRTTGFAQNVYDENEVRIEVVIDDSFVLQTRG